MKLVIFQRQNGLIFFIIDDYYVDEYLWLEEQIMAKNKLNKDREYQNYLSDRNERQKLRNHENICPSGDQNRNNFFAERKTVYNSNNKHSTESFTASSGNLTIGCDVVAKKGKSCYGNNPYVTKEIEKKTILNDKNRGGKCDETFFMKQIIIE